MQKRDRRAPLPGLTALRFFAATYVLFFHLYPVPASDAAHPVLLQRLVGAGFTGVSCFFILSGFILAYTHPQVTRVAQFFRARFARVYPLYLFAFLIALPNFLRYVHHTGNMWQLWAVPADLLLLQNWFPSLASLINTPAWTLSCEAFFYLLFPWLVSWTWLKTRRPFVALAALWLLQLVPPLLATFWILPHFPNLMPVCRTLLFTPLFRLGEFMAGIVLGSAFLRQQNALNTALPNTRRELLLPLALLLCLVFLSFNLILPHEVVRNGLLLGPYCLLIWALATSNNRSLASRPLQIGGEISYGVYLLQSPLAHWLYTGLGRSGLYLRHYRALNILLIYPLAWLTYLAIEKPCRNWILGKRPGSAAKPIPTPETQLP